eukprot:GHVU01216816.1.p1 GENE.GHVU01216816.1~~GHVU01216816.1.p1  ORF type:complete len:168 (-),score=25.06 GHVU01216816.1:594-1097(-)
MSCTTNLWNHYDSAHPGVIEDTRPAAKKRRVTTLPREVQEDCDNDLTMLLLETCKPLHMVEHPRFRSWSDKTSQGAYRLPTAYKVKKNAGRMHSVAMEVATKVLNGVHEEGIRTPVLVDAWGKGGAGLFGMLALVIVEGEKTFEMKEIAMVLHPFGKVSTVAYLNLE